MAHTLLEGDVRPSPVVDTDGRDPCERCAYRAVCGLLPEMEKTQIKKMARETFYADIREVTNSAGEKLDATANKCN